MAAPTQKKRTARSKSREAKLDESMKSAKTENMQDDRRVSAGTLMAQQEFAVQKVFKEIKDEILD